MLKQIREGLVDRHIRAKAAVHETPLDRFRVCVARDVTQYEDAFHLLHIAFAYQGIENVRSNKMRITPQHVLPEATVLVAYEKDQCVGTMTVTLDSPAGLPLEHDYAEPIEMLREQEAGIVEYGSLAVVRRCWSAGVTVLLNIAATYWSVNMLQATDIVMGVNPKAAPVYRAMYAFRPLGGSKDHASLVAPVIGMTTHLPHVREYTRKHFRTPLASGLTLTEHMWEKLPECIEIPANLPQHELPRWKLPRAVFQELFIEKSDRLDTLDPVTRKYLEKWRSNQTLESAHG